MIFWCARMGLKTYPTRTRQWLFGRGPLVNLRFAAVANSPLFPIQPKSA